MFLILNYISPILICFTFRNIIVTVRPAILPLGLIIVIVLKLNKTRVTPLFDATLYVPLD